jgi:integrase
MKELIEKYVQYQEHSWSETTRRSERYRLLALESVLTGDLPAELWEHLEKNYSSYSRVTGWTRVVSFYDWLLESGHKQGTNPYRIWRKRNARLFKHCYERKFPSIDYREAHRRIETIADGEIRSACLALLEGGLRISEIHTYDPGTATVRGKGGKRRKVYCEPFASIGRSDAGLRASLALLGLKPHDLRKLRATELRKRGLKEEDFLKVFGWTSMETAKSYLRPMKDEELEAKLTG